MQYSIIMILHSKVVVTIMWIFLRFPQGNKLLNWVKILQIPFFEGRHFTLFFARRRRFGERFSNFRHQFRSFSTFPQRPLCLCSLEWRWRRRNRRWQPSNFAKSFIAFHQKTQYLGLSWKIILSAPYEYLIIPHKALRYARLWQKLRGEAIDIDYRITKKQYTTTVI